MQILRLSVLLCRCCLIAVLFVLEGEMEVNGGEVGLLGGSGDLERGAGVGWNEVSLATAGLEEDDVTEVGLVGEPGLVAADGLEDNIGDFVRGVGDGGCFGLLVFRF